MGSTKKIFLIIALVYIALTMPTFFSWGGDASWVVTLISQSIRLSLWVLIAWVFTPEYKKIWILLLIAIFFNMPASISDIYYVDKYDNFFIFVRLWLLIPALFLTTKELAKGSV